MYGKLRCLATKLQPEIEECSRRVLEAMLDPDNGRESQYVAMATLYSVVAALELVAPGKMSIAAQLCEELDTLSEETDKMCQ